MAKNSFVKKGYYYRREKGGTKFLRIRPVREPESTGGAGTPTMSSQDTMASLLNPMSPAQIEKLAKSTIEAEFTPRRAAIAQARNQIKSDLKFGSDLNRELTANTDKVYGALPGQIKTAGDHATASISDGAKQVQDATNARNAAYQAAMKGDVRGQGLDGGYQGALETQQKEITASNQANRADAIQGSATGSQNSQDLADQMRGVGQLRSQELQDALQRKANERYAANDQDLAELAQSKAGAQSSLIQQMRKDEFTKAATIAGLDLKQQIALMENATKRYGIDTTAATTRRGQTLTFKLGQQRVNATLTEGEKNRTNAYNIALIRAAGKNGNSKSILGKLTPAQRAKLQQGNEKTRGAMEEALAALPSIREALRKTNAQNKAAGKQTFNPDDDAIIVKTIAKQFNLDPKLARGVYEMRSGGSLSAATRAYMKRMMIGVPGSWRSVGSPGAGTYNKPTG